MSSNKIKIAIVDDDFRTLSNLQKLLNYTGKVDVVATFQSGKSFMNALDKLSKDEWPEVVLMDIDMPDMNGIDCVLIGKAKFEQVKFLMLTVYDDEDRLFKAIKAGANGYLLKDEKISAIVQHLETLVYNGGVPLSPTIAAKILNHIKRAERTPRTVEPDFLITDRELQVLKLLVDGKDYKEIAIILFISSNTVKKHIAKIYSKLHVSSKAEAIKMVHFHRLLN